MPIIITPRRILPAAFCAALLSAPALHAQISSNPVDTFVAGSNRGSSARPRRGCAPLREPHPVPSIGAIADSAALSEAVAALAREFPMADSAFAAYTIAYGPGGVQGIRPVNYRLPSGQAEPFAGLVRRHLRSVGSSPGYLRLRVVFGEQPRFVVNNVERCPPELRTEFHMRTVTQAEYHAPITMRARVRVAPDGRILSVRLLRSSRDNEIDTWVLSVLQSGNALPGLIDGVPVEMEVEEDVRLRFN